MALWELSAGNPPLIKIVRHGNNGLVLIRLGKTNGLATAGKKLQSSSFKGLPGDLAFDLPSKIDEGMGVRQKSP